MEDSNNLIEWISNWFAFECNGDWEHENQIKILTTDNPGWYIEIDLTNTNLEMLEILNDTVEVAESDWYFFDVKDKKFVASGDLSKLSFLLLEFKKIVESKNV